ncbi:MAG: hypothetical protein J6O51_00830 [Bacteroidales bacterium]|nr:hypothetical protein [Bacteroidales bacterium]
MKKKDIINAVNALAKIPINKIKNDKVKFSLISDYRILRKEAKSIDEDRDILIKKFQEDFRDEIDVVAELRRSGLPVNDHKDFLKAESDLNKKLGEILQEETLVAGITPVSLDDLIKAISDTDLSFEDVNNLDCIIAN